MSSKQLQVVTEKRQSLNWLQMLLHLSLSMFTLLNYMVCFPGFWHYQRSPCQTWTSRWMTSSSCCRPWTTPFPWAQTEYRLSFWRIVLTHWRQPSTGSVSNDTGQLPGAWKHALVTPIFKKVDRKQAANYCPVSLTSTTCKVLEKVIVNTILAFAIDHGIILDQQHSFIPGSIFTNLPLHLGEWTRAG